MFKYTPLQEQLIEERKKNAALKAQTEKNTSDIDYVAMMTDIDLDNDVPNETEADENGNKFEKVKSYFERGLWDISRVRNAVVKSWITAEEYFTITGEIYGE